MVFLFWNGDSTRMSSLRDETLISPMVLAIADKLAERILRGDYSQDAWFPTERELTEEFGVSRTLIRSVVETLELRGLILRSPRCRTVVQKPNHSSTLPHSEGQRRTLGLWIWPSPGDPTSYALVNGIYQALDHDAFRLVTGNAYGDTWADVLQSEVEFLERIARDKDIAGIILWHLGGQQNVPALYALRAANIPLIFIDRRPPPGFEADYVGVDNEQAAETIVRHLIALGHRRIAHITNMDQASTVAERLRGYRRALHDAGLPAPPELIVMQREPDPHSETRRDVYAEMVTHFLALPDAPTAVFAVNDVVALHFADALRARGLDVPQAMSVTGFDGIERWQAGASFLTTAHQPFERVGRRAVEMLLYRLQSGRETAYRHIFLEAPLSVHASTGVPRIMLQSFIRQQR